MSSKDERAPIRERWTGMVSGGGDEATAGALLRTAMPFTISEKRLADVHARLRRHPRRESRARRPAGRLVGRLVFTVVIVAAFGGALSASVMHVLRARPATTSPGQGSDVGKKAVRRPSPHRPPAPEVKSEVEPDMPAPTPTPTGPVEVTAPAPASAVRPASPRQPTSPGRKLAAREPDLAPLPSMSPPIDRPHQPLAWPPSSAPPIEPAKPGWPWPSPPTQAAPGTPVAAPIAPVPAQPAHASTLARESRLLASAIAKLRQEGQPEQALRILDQYQAQFSSGTLAPEAATTRIEALLRLGRNSEALSFLDARPIDARGAGREMLVARAELRADRGRYAAALADFEAALASFGQSDTLVERALYGRARCRAKTGDGPGARRDFESYLASFPKGRFAEQARAAVEEIR